MVFNIHHLKNKIKMDSYNRIFNILQVQKNFHLYFILFHFTRCYEEKDTGYMPEISHPAKSQKSEVQRRRVK